MGDVVLSSKSAPTDMPESSQYYEKCLYIPALSPSRRNLSMSDLGQFNATEKYLHFHTAQKMKFYANEWESDCSESLQTKFISLWHINQWLCIKDMYQTEPFIKHEIYSTYNILMHKLKCEL